MTFLVFHDKVMVVGSTFLPAGRMRDQQIIADLLTAIWLDHELGHPVTECDICLAVEWGMVASAAAILRDLKLGFCTTLCEVIGSDADPSPVETEKFREIRGAEKPQDSPNDKG